MVMLKISELGPGWDVVKRVRLIQEQTTPSEFEVQAYLYNELKLRGYHVRGEVSLCGERERMDLVIYGDEEADGGRMPVRGIEVKRSHDAESESQCLSQAKRYYEKYGIPVDVVAGMHAARMYLLRIYSILPPHAFCEGWG